MFGIVGLICGLWIWFACFIFGVIGRLGFDLEFGFGLLVLWLVLVFVLGFE